MREETDQALSEAVSVDLTQRLQIAIQNNIIIST